MMSPDKDKNKNKKIHLIIGILILLFVVLGSCGFFYYHLPFKLIPFQIPFIPKDSSLISETLHQEMPGYSQVEVLAASGSNQGNDPRLISIRVKLDTGETPIICEGQIFSWIGDPGNRGIRWQNLECEGLATLIGYTQSVLTTTYEPNTVWYPPFYSCFNDQIASVLYYWTKADNTVFARIGWPRIETTVEEMLAGKIGVMDQVVLFDPKNIEIIDYDPQLPDDQKTRLYYLECDGTIKEYVGKSYLEIQQNRGSIQDFQLHNPIEENNP
jgi:hypothetical protein